MLGVHTTPRLPTCPEEGTPALHLALRMTDVEDILNILMINYKIMKGLLATANGSYRVPLHPTNCPLGMYYIDVPLFINKD
jgi:hypothetical protein